MDELKRALYALIYQAGLTEAEAAQLTLKDLHLAGAEPHITVWDEKTGRRRSVRLSEMVRNAVVTWMLMRPDRPVTLLFPGNDEDGFTAEEIKEMLADYAPSEKTQPAPDPLPVSPETIIEEGLPTIEPSGRQTAPPPFRASSPSFSPEQIKRPERVATSPPPISRPTPEPPPVQKPGSPSPQTKPSSAPSSGDSRKRSYFLIISGVLVILGCGGLLVGGMTFLPSSIVPLSLIGGGETPEAEVETTTTSTPAAVSISPVNIPSPEPTATPTPIDMPTLPPTDTPMPEPTATPVPTNTVSPVPTETLTPEATDTPIPTNTPQPAPSPTSPPTPTQASGLKYPAPRLLSPEADARFFTGNIIDLKWEPVGELAGDEQYAVRLIYSHANEVVYRGDQLRETQWTVPPYLHREADGPQFDYIWYVYVEHVQPDGIGIPISPESERRHFTWE